MDFHTWYRGEIYGWSFKNQNSNNYKNKTTNLPGTIQYFKK